MIRVADYISKFLVDKEITHVFGYIGGMITFIVDAINKTEGLKYIQVYHEQTASIAAEGYALVSGKPGVAISTSGPGATNMITGIADAYFASVPVIYITGQVSTKDYKWNKPIRQQGFQETDIVKIVEPITKYAKLISDAEQIPFELEKAYTIAISGRPGPVLLDIPIDIQKVEINDADNSSYKYEEIPFTPYFIDEIGSLILKSQRPMILIGGGCKSTKKAEILKDFIYQKKFPIVYSLMGKGIISDTYKHNFGFIGSYGNRSSNISLINADLIIALGSRLDVRQTGADFESFLKNGKKIIHVDSDINELTHHRLSNRIIVNESVDIFINKLKPILNDYKLPENWISYLANIENNYNQEHEINRFVENKSPYKLIDTVNTYSNHIDIITSDIGQNQMWAAQHLNIKDKQRFFTSGGLAPMGFSIPAAIGMAIADSKLRIISINGDGGFHISLQSLMLIKQYNLNIKVIVINNQSLGMITQFQELYFNDNMVGTTKDSGYLVPNIMEIAKAYNIPYFSLEEADLENQNLLFEIFKNTKNCIVEYKVYGKPTVSPKLEYNSSYENPTPKLDQDEMKNIMIFS